MENTIEQLGEIQVTQADLTEKEILHKCAWHRQEFGTEGWMMDGVVIDENKEIVEAMERKIAEDIAVISHGICSMCAEVFYPEE